METNPNIILAIYPNPLGFGYAFMENARTPWDCGVVKVKPASNKENIRRIISFIEYYEPELVVLQDYEGKYEWKGRRVKKLIQEIKSLATKLEIKVQQYTREQIRTVFEQLGAKTKYEIAEVISQELKQFKKKMPDLRKPWMPEDYHMGMFDALSLAITHFFLIEQPIVTEVVRD